MSNARHVSLPVETRAEADWGAGDPMRSYRDVLVDDDGTVRVWDDVAGHYTLWHRLTEAQIAEARRLAGVTLDV